MTLSEHKILLYEAVNKINGKRYVGITRRGLHVRRKRHLHTARSGGGAVIGSAIRKYGKENFEFRTLVICPDFEYANVLEQRAIAAFKPEYNLTDGGGGVLGYKLSEQAKQKISSAMKGRKNSLGNKLSEEHKNAIRLSRLSGKGGTKKGTKLKLSPEQREARRQRMLGRRHSLGYRHTADAKARMRIIKAGNPAVARKVICLDTGEIFPSVIAASRKIDRARKSIRQVCLGKHRTVGGLKFKYADALT